MEEENEKMKSKIDLLDILLDKDNKDPIVFEDKSGKLISFEQIAIIPYEVGGEKKLYAFLKPIDKIEGISEDEAVIFRVDISKDGVVLRVEEDEQISVAVFNMYRKLFKDATGEDY